MPLKYKTNGGGGDFKSVPSGSHIAVCNLVADLGLQPGSAAYPAPKHKVYIRFEVQAERVDYEKDGKKFNLPAVIGQAFTASMHEKSNLRKQLEGWRGRKFTDDEASNFDVSTILGKGCMLSVIENVVGDKVYSNIAAISGLPKGMPAQTAENDLLYYAEDDTASLKSLPEWIQEKIANKVKPKAESATGTYADRPDDFDYGYNQHNVQITDDDIPF